jgi:hypothetical protein
MSEPKAEHMGRGIQVEVVQGTAFISFTLRDLILLAKIGPGMEYVESLPPGKVKIVDEAVFAQSVLRAMQHEDPHHGRSFLAKLIDDAVELVIEKKFPGFEQYDIKETA